MEQPSVTLGPSQEDSKFLMESSIAQQSLLMPHMSKLTENEDNEPDHNRPLRGMQNIPENNSLYQESQGLLEGGNQFSARTPHDQLDHHPMFPPVSELS